MKKFNGSLLTIAALMACCAFVSNFATANFEEEQPTKSKLTYKSYMKWNILLPKETFTPAVGSIKVGSGFKTEIDGMALAIDCNADGKVDEKAKGTGGIVTLKGKQADGSKFKYTVRLVNDGGWKWATSGALEGKVNGVKVRIIDQNNNGRFNDFGEDAICVGKSLTASFLSRVINAKGQLVEIEIDSNGDEISYKPYTGKAGLLNLRSKFKANAKLEAAIVVSENGDYSFNLANAKKGLLIPEGLYTVKSGKIAMGKETALIKEGISKPIRVTADEPAVFAWGGPVRAEFTYDRNGEEVTFSPQNLSFYGKAGEEYHTWIPTGAPPKFVIKDAKGREITQAKFGAS
ncbi:MAG: hypothetical protein ACI97A_004366 [Planctomycetota bacterium]|jgi:hypothetical protein